VKLALWYEEQCTRASFRDNLTYYRNRDTRRMALPESLPSSKYSNPLQPSLPRRGLDCAADLFIEKALKFQGKILHCIGVIFVRDQSGQLAEASSLFRCHVGVNQEETNAFEARCVGLLFPKPSCAYDGSSPFADCNTICVVEMLRGEIPASGARSRSGGPFGLWLGTSTSVLS